ncbi:hypothetical protein [Defluviimonas sp. D31]|nr:hypothetical protein [Defluviimonas sp. D31]
MMTQGLSRDDARQFLTHVIERELARISRDEPVTAALTAGPSSVGGKSSR